MSAKSKTHDAAQKKLWKADIKTLKSAASKITRDFDLETRRRIAAVDKAERALRKEQSALNRFLASRDKKLPASLKSIETRIAILSGRLNS